MKLWISWFNILNLDVVTGSLLSGAFAAVVLNVRLPATYWTVLGLSVWILYTADHLVDARRLKDKAHTPRHLFAYGNFRLLSGLIVVLLLIDLALVFFYLDRVVLYFGLSAGMITAGYFGLIHLTGEKGRYYLKKELVVSLIYTAGIWGVPVLAAGEGPDLVQVLLVLGFFLLAVMNTLVLSYHDRESDRADKHITFAVVYGGEKVKKAIHAMGGVILLLGAAVLFLAFGSEIMAGGIIYFLMALLMLFLVYPAKALNSELVFRILTEQVFWLPGLILFF